MTDKEKLRGTLDMLIEQIPLVGGVPEGDYRGRENTRVGKDPEEIFNNCLPVCIQFGTLPKEPVTARFVLFGVGYDLSPQKYPDKGKSKMFLRLGFPQNTNKYSTADMSHLSIARLAAQEIFDKYNTLARLEDLGDYLQLNNLIFFSSGHGTSIWVELLSKRFEHNGGSYLLDLNTQDGGFVTYYPDGTIVLGGESRHLSPSPGYSSQQKEIDIAKRAHQNNLELAKRVFEEFLSQQNPNLRVIFGSYKVIDEHLTHSPLYRVVPLANGGKE